MSDGPTVCCLPRAICGRCMRPSPRSTPDRNIAEGHAGGMGGRLPAAKLSRMCAVATDSLGRPRSAAPKGSCSGRGHLAEGPSGPLAVIAPVRPEQSARNRLRGRDSYIGYGRYPALTVIGANRAQLFANLTASGTARVRKRSPRTVCVHYQISTPPPAGVPSRG